MRVKADGLSDIGRRRQSNEDSLFIDDGNALFIVADGVGGQPAGEVASRLVAEQLPDIVTRLAANDAAAGKILDRAIRDVNSALINAAKSNPAWTGMSTTVVVAWCRAGEVTIANVGDSRAYLIRDQQIELVSEDHTVLAEQQRDGLVANDVTDGRMAHVLTRCLGLEPEVDVTVGSFPVRVGDRILLCSDGLTDSLSEEVIRSVTLASTSPKETCRMLVELANRNGGHDNITVILIFIDEDTLKKKISNLFGRRS